MGNNSSVRQEACDAHSTSGQHSCPIKKEEFLQRFNVSIRSLGEHIWRRYSSTDVLLPEDYSKLLNELTDRSDKLLYIISLLNDEELAQDDIAVLISWLSFGRKLEDHFRKTVFKALLTLEYPFKKEKVCTCLRPMFSDFSEDLVKIVHCSLINGAVSMNFEVSSGFTNLLNEDVLWILALFLSSPYKRPNPTRLGSIAPLEIEQLSHLHCLFNSNKHGFSITRIQELAFDYNGPLIMLLKAEDYLFCLASDQGLKDSFKTYGAENSRLIQILPELVKLVSGHSLKSGAPGGGTGMIYSNFTLKTARRGLLVGHQPTVSPAIEIDEGFTTLRFAGSAQMKLTAVEIWAAGATAELDKQATHKAWELKQVNKEKNRKFKLEEDWRESADRHLLNMAGVRVHHSEAVANPENM